MKFAHLLIPLLSLPFCNCYTLSHPCPTTSITSTAATALPQISVSSSSSNFNSRLPYSAQPGVVENVWDAAFTRAVLDCSHSAPVRWIADFHPQKDAFSFIQSFHQQIEPSNYSAFGVLLYKAVELREPSLFICESICDGRKTFLEISPGPIIRVKDSPSNQVFAALAKKLSSSPLQNVSVDCGMILVIQALVNGEEEPELYYTWVDPSGGMVEQIAESSQLTTDQGIFYRSVFRSVVEKTRRDCVIQLRDDRLCRSCKKVVTKSSSTYEDSIHLNSVAFYGKSSTGLEMAFKGVFSLTRPRKFYFDWELPLQEMIDFTPPAVVYIGFEVLLNCSVSTIYFAYGTLIYQGDDILFYNTSQINSGEREEWGADGRRVVTKKMNFHSQNETITVTCSAPFFDWSKRVAKTAQIFVDSASRPEIEGARMSPIEEILIGGEEELEPNITLSCTSVGRPRPILDWVFPNQNISDYITLVVEEDLEDPDKISSNLTITLEKENLHLVTGTYLCISHNIAGNASKSFRLQLPPEGLSKTTIALLSSGLGAVAVLGIATLLLIQRQILVQRREYRTKTEEAIKEFKEGIKNAGSKDKQQPAKKERPRSSGRWASFPVFMYRRFSKKRYERELEEVLDPAGNEPNHHISILELPYQDDFEVHPDKWEIGSTVLGQGAFGIVKKGTVQIEDKATVVAIKMLKSSVEIEDFKGFLTELKIMAYIGPHSNIVSLVAASTSQIEEREVMIGVEFCHNGSLKDYLEKNREAFLQARGSGGNIGQTKEASSAGWSNYANTAENWEPITELDLVTWAYQIANGMEFLGSKKVLHGDLATRNVLLTLDKSAKISDFGLSRLLLENKNYTKKSKTPLPWKWMSIEALKTLTFSTASDVWSYSVTLFELFTLGEVPYAGMSYSREFIFQLEAGFRLRQPPYCSEYVYNIMKHCWAADVADRLTFFQIKTAFSDLLKGGGTSREPGSTERYTTPNSNINRTLNILQPINRTPVATPRVVGIELGVRSGQDNWYTNDPQKQVPQSYHNIIRE